MNPHKHSDDAAAYVLGALEPVEADGFRRHLEECVVCRDEVAAFREAVDALPDAGPRYRAPKKLRRRVIKTLRAEAKNSHAPAQTAGERRRARLAPWGPAPIALATVAAIGAAGFAGVELAGGGGSGAPRTITASLGDAEVRVIGGHAELIVGHLPAPPAGRIYELWIKRGERAPQPTNTLFSVNDHGSANIGVPGTVTGDTSVLVTAEPVGGTSAPTTTPVIVATLR